MSLWEGRADGQPAGCSLLTSVAYWDRPSGTVVVDVRCSGNAVPHHQHLVPKYLPTCTLDEKLNAAAAVNLRSLLLLLFYTAMLLLLPHLLLMMMGMNIFREFRASDERRSEQSICMPRFLDVAGMIINGISDFRE